MAISGNIAFGSDGVSRLATGLLRLAFRFWGSLAPKSATKAAVWLFTKPKRSQIRADESQLLAAANCYFLKVDSHELAVMEWGRGPAVLCLHGWSSRGLRFRNLIDQLVKSGYRVIAFDAPAHGRSSGSHVDVMGYAECILAIAERVGPIHAIVAHSFGAAATLLALEKGLITDRVIFFSALNGIRGPLDYLADKLGISDEVLSSVKKSFEDKFNRSIESLEALKIVPQLITQPLLVVHDKDDPILPFHNAVDLVGVWKNSELITTHGIGHETILDDPNLIEKVVCFLEL